MKIFINYSDENFAQQQKFALRMAKRFGKCDRVIGYGPDDIDGVFLRKTGAFLQRKGVPVSGFGSRT